MLREWVKLPKFMQTEEVRPYYDSLKKKKISFKFAFNRRSIKKKKNAYTSISRQIYWQW